MIMPMKSNRSTGGNISLIDGFSTATEMLQALRQGQLSAVELLELHLRRIERYNPTLNAIITPNYDDARRASVAADEARARGEALPLLGIPLTIKDCIYVEGLPTTGGVPERAQAISEAHAPVVARVEAAGAVIMGKTNVPPFASDWQSSNPLFGKSNNPWDLTLTPGGSTGGGAAAVAAGLTPLEFGGDFGGSIRIPAAFCGIYGHKPSETAVPRRGHFPGPNVPNAATAMAVQGPLARSVGDLELALDVIAGPDLDEDVGWRLEMPRARHKNLADYRVAILPPISWVPVDDEIAAALDNLATSLGRFGAQVEETQPEVLGDLREYCRIYISIFSAISSIGRPDPDRRQEAEVIRRRTQDLMALAWAEGLEASASDYLIWFGQREEYRAGYRSFFEQWDVLLAPANVVNAFPHNDAPEPERQLDVNGELVPYGLQFVYPSLCNFSGLPGTAFPIGQTKLDLPIGLQAVGPYLEDRTSINFTSLVAREFGGFRRPGGYDEA
jgi:amidase